MKNILTKLLIGFAILVVVFCLLLYCGYGLFSRTKYRNIKDYKICLNKNYYQADVAHFPMVIPSDAREIKFYCIPADYEHSAGLILLKFKIDENYIEKELKNYEFLNSDDKVGTPQNIYNMPSKYVGIKSEDLTYYVLRNKNNESVKNEYFPYFSGIGISKDKNTILYYSIRPD